jgi:hypothetical protein
MVKAGAQQGSRSAYLLAYDEWVKDYYGQLMGARVVGIGLGADLCPILVFEMAEGKRVHLRLTSDEDGAGGPGYLQGLPPVKRRGA